MVIVSLTASYLLTVLMMREYERPRHRLSIVLVMTALVYLVTSLSSPLIFEHADPILLLFAGISLVMAIICLLLVDFLRKKINISKLLVQKTA